MSARPTTDSMTHWATTCAVAMSLSAALGCGKTTNVRQTRADEDGGVGAGAAVGGAGVGGSRANADGSLTGDGSSAGDGGDGIGGSSLGGGGGAGGSGTFTGGSAGTSTGGAAGCNLPMPTPVPNPTVAETDRLRLIHDFCVTLERDGCIDVLGGSSFVHWQLGECSSEQRITACEQDRLYEYYQGILPECDDEWQTAIICAAAATYDYETTCFSASLGGSTPGRTIPCQDEKLALQDCRTLNDPWQEVTGARTTCDYGPGTFSQCEVSCPLGDNHFLISCGGPAGLPVRCLCEVNGHAIGDLNFTTTEVFYASSCADAAAQAADGKCTNRLDCCFAYHDGVADQCLCGSDPSLLGFSSCAEVAQSVGGQVVDICPQYQVSNTCWPPPCG